MSHSTHFTNLANSEFPGGSSAIGKPMGKTLGKRILIVSASAGTGHLRAAAALEKAFRGMPDIEEVRSIDALKYTNRLFRDFYSKLYTQLVAKAPTFLGWWYKTSGE
ncbi:MAG: hypothetical protein K8R38_09485, partial [Verrucomicrobia bacterium]|nr:hypothetical protein [Verrucomicrobiota bacterium]